MIPGSTPRRVALPLLPAPVEDDCEACPLEARRGEKVLCSTRSKVETSPTSDGFATALLRKAGMLPPPPPMMLDKGSEGTNSTMPSRRDRLMHA